MDTKQAILHGMVVALEQDAIIYVVSKDLGICIEYINGQTNIRVSQGQQVNGFTQVWRQNSLPKTANGINVISLPKE